MKRIYLHVWVERRSSIQAMEGKEYKVLFNDVYIHVNIQGC